MKLTKCLIANRGEIAVRIMRACRELGIGAAAVYSDADAGAMHAQIADEAHAIGAANPAESYLNIDKLIAAARTAGCDCVHPGYGFLSESEAFAQAVIDAGLVWVGPPPEAIRRMGVKTEARALMQTAGVPLAPGYQGDGDEQAFLDAAERIGYPVMVKAAGGGGGKGIRVVTDPADLPDALQAARREAQHAFNDSRVFLERFVERARHVEIQVIADRFGHTVHLFERECSAQRRHQKVIEESPSPLLEAALRARMGAAGVAAAQAVGYVNAGTVEFIAAPDGEFYFLEMNTRLQVEHPVTEYVTGLDLVKLQFAIAAGEPLPFTQDEVSRRGHAIECRVYAEDPRGGFLPAVGDVLHFHAPEGVGVRVDSGIKSGDTIPIHYDPLIAKIIAYDRDRPSAIQRMDAALRDTMILGTTTNLGFLRALINHPAFVAGEVDTGFIERHAAELVPPDSSPPDAALIAAALLESAVAPVSAAQTDDPWSRGDNFRIGQGR
ncbi:MAG: acetyl-CoA carboxylase biotin carboxylase subunit [Anaerolineae bacterium]|nr:acetyl-CoA carboxylase biotin carboxylase subunit [Anaerolineae bacterium]